MNGIHSTGGSAASTLQSTAIIDVRIQRIEQLLDALDPSPFNENETLLRRDAESYIVDSAGEYARAESLQLVVHAPNSIKPHAAEITRAIHAHFERAHIQCRRRYRRRMRIGRTLLMVGVAVLGVALLLRALLGDPGDRPTIVAASEGLLILGWVAMWRPLEILLFEGLENHQQSSLLQRLSLVTVNFEFDVELRSDPMSSITEKNKLPTKDTQT